MRVINLQAENFKILKAVDITPGDGPVVIGGKNDQGKSSVMDAIWVALKGRAMAPPKPIRAGEEECVIRLDIGEYKVQRRFTAKEGGSYTDSVKVVDDRDRVVQKPQQVLDRLLGAVGFDPFEFTRLRPEDQAEQLLQLVPLPIDLEEFAEEDARDYATRRERNREAEQVEAQLRGIPVEEVPTDLPDRDALVQQLAGAADTNTELAAERARRDGLIQKSETQARTADQDRVAAREIRQRADGVRTEIARLQAEAARLDDAAKKKDEDAVEMDRLSAETRADHDALPPVDPPVDTAAIQQRLREAEAQHAAAERMRRRGELQTRLDGLKAASQKFTEAMEDRERQRREALQKAKMPVEGLGFAVNEKGKPVVTYRDLPFSQAGKAVQIKASTAIAMAANPELRILRITDGSLLDDESLAMIAEMADAEDVQLWIEVVGEGGAGIIIENGEVKADKAADPVAGPDESDAVAYAAAAKPKAKKSAAAKPADGALL